MPRMHIAIEGPGQQGPQICAFSPPQKDLTNTILAAIILPHAK